MARFFRSFLILLMAIVGFHLVSTTAQAGSRYGTPPPAVLSPDLTAPWVLQLKSHPVPNGYNNSGYRVGIARPIVRRAPVYRQPVYRQPAALRRTISPNYRTNRSTVQPAVRVKTKRASTVVKRKTRQASIIPAKKKSGSNYDPKFENQVVAYQSNKKPGSIIIDTNDKFLYLVMGGGQARRYGVGVGKPGFEWAGTHKITRKAEWPSWNPPAQMIAREKKKGRTLPAHMKGGPNNPLGARALYLGSTLYRIHGTNSPWTIGKAVSSGCIRMRNEDVMDLYERVGVGTRVTVS